VRRYPHLGGLNQHRLAYLLEHGEPPTGDKPCEWGKARLVPKWALALSTYEAAISINARVWEVLSERQQEALLLHELHHLDHDNETGKLVTRPHDVEEFSFVAREYGAWRTSLSLFAEQLHLGLRASGD
jgi:hypothetical protein